MKAGTPSGSHMQTEFESSGESARSGCLQCQRGLLPRELLEKPCCAHLALSHINGILLPLVVFLFGFPSGFLRVSFGFPSGFLRVSFGPFCCGPLYSCHLWLPLLSSKPRLLRPRCEARHQEPGLAEPKAPSKKESPTPPPNEVRQKSKLSSKVKGLVAEGLRG